MLNWENVDKGRKIERAKVFGGWLVLLRTMQLIEVEVPIEGVIASGHQMKERRIQPLNGIICMTFISDPAHEWIIEPEVEGELKIMKKEE